MNADRYFTDFPTRPMGGGNPYHCCDFCGVTVPSINGRLEGHDEDCEYRVAKQLELAREGVDEIAAAARAVELADSAMIGAILRDDHKGGYRYSRERDEAVRVLLATIRRIDGKDLPSGPVASLGDLTITADLSSARDSS